MKIIGENIKKFREEIGLSGADLAEALTKSGCKCTARTIYNWEREITTPDANELAEMHLIFGKELNLFFKKIGYAVIFILSILSFCSVGFSEASEAGKEMTKEFEGFRAKIYSCPAGYKTIGYGFNLDNKSTSNLFVADFVRGDREITKSEADIIFEVLYLQAEKDAREFAGYEQWERMRVLRQDILTDMAYNLGRRNFFEFKKLRAAVQTGDYKTAAEEMKNSLWYKQTGRRARHHVERFAEEK